MSACCNGRIVISHSQLDGSVIENSEFCLLQDREKVYDPHLTWPYSLLCCGATGSGKTSFVLGLLKNREILSTHTSHKLIWIYGVSQPEFFREIHTIRQYR